MDEPLPIGFYQFVHDHRHGSDESAQGESEPAGSLTPLPVANVMQTGFLDRIALVRIAELRPVPGDDYVVAGLPRISEHVTVALARSADLGDVVNVMSREDMPQRLHKLHRRVLVDEDTHYAARRAG